MKFILTLASLLAGILVTLAYFRPRFKFFRDVRGLNLYEATNGDILPRSRMPLAGDWELNIIGKVWNFRVARRQIALWRNFKPVFQLFPEAWSFKRQLLVSLLLTVVIQLACSGAEIVAGFKAGLAASKPFVQSLVDSKTITDEQARNATDDLDESVTSLASAVQCLETAKPLSGGAKRVAKAKCYFAAAQNLRNIFGRGNFAVNDRLNRVSLIASGAIEAFEAYFTKVTTGPEVTGPDGGITHTGADGLDGENADKELERSLKERKKELDALLKGN